MAALSSLSRYTVPGAGGGQSSTVQGLLMPKLKYRFRVTLENFGITKPVTELTKQVVTAARPQVQFENQIIHVYNSQIKYAGKPTWQSLAISVRDDVGGNVTKVVGEQLQKQFDFFEQASAYAGADYKFLTRIEMLDGGNGAFDAGVLETWECVGCYLQTVNYNELAYAESTPMEIALTIEFDNAIQVDKSGNPVGLGANVGRSIAQDSATGSSGTGG
jgi:hypothetical protein